MTQLNLGTSSISAAAAAQGDKRPLFRLKRFVIALLLGLLVPGLGQIYARRPWRGIAMAVSLALLTAIIVIFRLFLSFWGLVISFPLSLVWRLWIAGDGCYVACKELGTSPPPRHVRMTIAATAIVFLLVGYPVPNYFGRRLLGSFRAYKISSGSMSPTICQGERVVVAADAYKIRGPARGDLIVFDFNSSGTIFPKRVIGIAGDTVSAGPANTILVDDMPLKVPGPCAFRYFGGSYADLPSFKAVKIPEGTVFVVGDNLSNSYDSRFFGPIPLNEVRGKLKFIYWSPNRSRIGCELH